MIARCWISDSFSQKIEAFERGEIQSEPLEKLRVAAHAQGMRIAEYVLSMANYGIVLDSAKPAQEVVCNAQPIAEDDTEDVEFLQAPPDGATWWEWLQYDQEVERTRQHPTSQATLSLKVINNAGEIRDAWIPARDPPSSRLSLQYGVLEEARRTYLHGSRLDDMGVNPTLQIIRPGQLQFDWSQIMALLRQGETFCWAIDSSGDLRIGLKMRARDITGRPLSTPAKRRRIDDLNYVTDMHSLYLEQASLLDEDAARISGKFRLQLQGNEIQLTNDSEEFTLFESRSGHEDYLINAAQIFINAGLRVTPYWHDFSIDRYGANFHLDPPRRLDLPMQQNVFPTATVTPVHDQGSSQSVAGDFLKKLISKATVNELYRGAANNDFGIDWNLYFNRSRIDLSHLDANEFARYVQVIHRAYLLLSDQNARAQNADQAANVAILRQNEHEAAISDGNAAEIKRRYRFSCEQLGAYDIEDPFLDQLAETLDKSLGVRTQDAKLAERQRQIAFAREIPNVINVAIHQNIALAPDFLHDVRVQLLLFTENEYARRKKELTAESEIRYASELSRQLQANRDAFWNQPVDLQVELEQRVHEFRDAKTAEIKIRAQIEITRIERTEKSAARETARNNRSEIQRMEAEFFQHPPTSDSLIESAWTVEKKRLTDEYLAEGAMRQHGTPEEAQAAMLDYLREAEAAFRNALPPKEVILQYAWRAQKIKKEMELNQNLKRTTRERVETMTQRIEKKEVADLAALEKEMPEQIRALESAFWEKPPSEDEIRAARWKKREFELTSQAKRETSAIIDARLREASSQLSAEIEATKRRIETHAAAVNETSLETRMAALRGLSEMLTTGVTNEESQWVTDSAALAERKILVDADIQSERAKLVQRTSNPVAVTALFNGVGAEVDTEAIRRAAVETQRSWNALVGTERNRQTVFFDQLLEQTTLALSQTATHYRSDFHQRILDEHQTTLPRIKVWSELAELFARNRDKAGFADACELIASDFGNQPLEGIKGDDLRYLFSLADSFSQFSESRTCSEALDTILRHTTSRDIIASTQTEEVAVAAAKHYLNHGHDYILRAATTASERIEKWMEFGEEFGGIDSTDESFQVACAHIAKAFQKLTPDELDAASLSHLSVLADTFGEYPSQKECHDALMRIIRRFSTDQSIDNLTDEDLRRFDGVISKAKALDIDGDLISHASATLDRKRGERLISGYISRMLSAEESADVLAAEYIRAGGDRVNIEDKESFVKGYLRRHMDAFRVGRLEFARDQAGLAREHLAALTSGILISEKNKSKYFRELQGKFSDDEVWKQYVLTAPDNHWSYLNAFAGVFSGEKIFPKSLKKFDDVQKHALDSWTRIEKDVKADEAEYSFKFNAPMACVDKLQGAANAREAEPIVMAEEETALDVPMIVDAPGVSSEAALAGPKPKEVREDERVAMPKEGAATLDVPKTKDVPTASSEIPVEDANTEVEKKKKKKKKKAGKKAEPEETLPQQVSPQVELLAKQLIKDLSKDNPRAHASFISELMNLADADMDALAKTVTAHPNWKELFLRLPIVRSVELDLKALEERLPTNNVRKLRYYSQLSKYVQAIASSDEAIRRAGHTAWTNALAKADSVDARNTLQVLGTYYSSQPNKPLPNTLDLAIAGVAEHHKNLLNEVKNAGVGQVPVESARQVFDAMRTPAGQRAVIRAFDAREKSLQNEQFLVANQRTPETRSLNEWQKYSRLVDNINTQVDFIDSQIKVLDVLEKTASPWSPAIEGVAELHQAADTRSGGVMGQLASSLQKRAVFSSQNNRIAEGESQQVNPTWLHDYWLLAIKRPARENDLRIFRNMCMQAANILIDKVNPEELRTLGFSLQADEEINEWLLKTPELVKYRQMLNERIACLEQPLSGEVDWEEWRKRISSYIETLRKGDQESVHAATLQWNAYSLPDGGDGTRIQAVVDILKAPFAEDPPNTFEAMLVQALGDYRITMTALEAQPGPWLLDKLNKAFIQVTKIRDDILGCVNSGNEEGVKSHVARIKEIQQDDLKFLNNLLLPHPTWTNHVNLVVSRDRLENQEQLNIINPAFQEERHLPEAHRMLNEHLTIYKAGNPALIAAAEFAWGDFVKDKKDAASLSVIRRHLINELSEPPANMQLAKEGVQEYLQWALNPPLESASYFYLQRCMSPLPSIPIAEKMRGADFEDQKVTPSNGLADAVNAINSLFLNASLGSLGLEQTRINEVGEKNFQEMSEQDAHRLLHETDARDIAQFLSKALSTLQPSPVDNVRVNSFATDAPDAAIAPGVEKAIFSLPDKFSPRFFAATRDSESAAWMVSMGVSPPLPLKEFLGQNGRDAVSNLAIIPLPQALNTDEVGHAIGVYDRTLVATRLNAILKAANPNDRGSSPTYKVEALGANDIAYERAKAICRDQVTGDAYLASENRPTFICIDEKDQKAAKISFHDDDFKKGAEFSIKSKPKNRHRDAAEISIDRLQPTQSQGGERTIKTRS